MSEDGEKKILFQQFFFLDSRFLRSEDKNKQKIFFEYFHFSVYITVIEHKTKTVVFLLLFRCPKTGYPFIKHLKEYIYILINEYVYMNMPEYACQ